MSSEVDRKSEGFGYNIHSQSHPNYVKSDQQSESAETDSNIGSVYKGPHENFKDIDDLINKQRKEREDDRFKEMQR